MNSNLLGEQIAKFRKELGMTQEDLSKAVSIRAAGSAAARRT